MRPRRRCSREPGRAGGAMDEELRGVAERGQQDNGRKHRGRWSARLKACVRLPNTPTPRRERRIGDHGAHAGGGAGGQVGQQENQRPRSALRERRLPVPLLTRWRTGCAI